MADTVTPFLNLTKPEVNGEHTENVWGFDLNTNFDKLDTFGDQVWRRAGGELVQVGDTPPVDPARAIPSHGDLWWESDLGALFIYYDDGTSKQWVGLNGFSGPPGPQGPPGEGGGGTPGGSNTQVQYNDSSAFGGHAAFTFDETIQKLSVTDAATGGGSVWASELVTMNYGAVPTWGSLVFGSGPNACSLFYDDANLWIDKPIKGVTAAVGEDSTIVATTAWVKDQGYAAATISTLPPSGGNDGDVWYQVPA